MSDLKKQFSVLVVDDERTNIDYLAYILKPLYTILVAKNGKTALDIARRQMPDLILLDVMMPGMSGFDVLEELKSSHVTKKIPVIFITGRDNPEDEERGFSLGASDYITKPFNNSTVLARVQTQLKVVEYIQEIERLGMTDPLTGLPNRRSFDSRAYSEWNRAIREKAPISVLIIDIDKFKEYNDRNGHAEGDSLLKTLAEVFKVTIKRSADFASRWGGDEFTVLLPNVDLSGAETVGELIRSNFEQAAPYKDIEKTVKMSISVGVNVEKPVVGDALEEFLARADKALYAAKDDGGNCVRPFSR